MSRATLVVPNETTGRIVSLRSQPLARIRPAFGHRVIDRQPTIALRVRRWTRARIEAARVNPMAFMGGGCNASA